MEIRVFDIPLEIDESQVDASPEEIHAQVAQYERGERTSFDLTVDIQDDFTGQVMEQMHTIPYGTTVTYGEIARTLDTAPIAVGGACGRNRVPLIVPCHRVIGTDGELHGYSGGGDRGLELKARLLEHEQHVRQTVRP